MKIFALSWRNRVFEWLRLVRLKGRFKIGWMTWFSPTMSQLWRSCLSCTSQIKFLLLCFIVNLIQESDEVDPRFPSIRDTSFSWESIDSQVGSRQSLLDNKGRSRLITSCSKLGTTQVTGTRRGSSGIRWNGIGFIEMQSYRSICCSFKIILWKANYLWKQGLLSEKWQIEWCQELDFYTAKFYWYNADAYIGVPESKL